MVSENKVNIILAIDDRRENLLTYEAVVNSKLPDCKLITATSAKTGIELAQKQLPDVIIVDVVMPYINGYETCEILKSSQLTKRIPVIMITAVKTDSESMAMALDKGADAFISKPIKPVQLVAQIKAMLRIKNAEDKLLNEKNMWFAQFTSKSQELEKNIEAYNTLYQISENGIITTNNKLFVTGINNAFTDITGIKSEDIVGLHAVKFAKKYLKGTSLKFMLILIENIILAKKPQPLEINFNNKILQVYYSHSTNHDIVGIVKDVTELKKTLDALKNSEMYFKTLIENSTDVVSILDYNGNIIYESPSHKNVLGYNENNLLGTNCFDLVHPDDIQDIVEKFKYLVNRPNDIVNVNFRFKHFNGSWKYLEGTGKNLLESQYINGIVVNYRDVTERINAQNELQKNEKLLKKISENYPNSFLCIVNKEMIIEFISGQEFKNQNIDPNHYIGIYVDQLPKVITIDLKSIYLKTFEGVEQISEFSLGDKHFILRTVPLIDDDGKINKILSVTENITLWKKTQLALKQSETRFRQLFNQFADAVFVTVIDGKDQGRILEVNPAAIKQTGYSRDELLNMNILDDLTDNETTVFNDNDWHQKLNKGEAITLTEKKINSSGNKYWTEVIVSAIDYNDEKACLSINRDVTNRKIIENQLIENQILLNAIFESTGEGIVVLDNNQNITHCNNEFLKIIGLQTTDNRNSEQNLIKTLLTKIKDSKKFIEVNNIYSKSIESVKDIIKFDNGKIYERKNQPLIIDEKVEGRVWSFNDITENKKNELIRSVLYNISNTSNISTNLNSHISIIQKELGKILDTRNMYIALYNDENHNYNYPFYSDEKNDISRISNDNTLNYYVISRETPLLANLETRKRLQKIKILYDKPQNFSKVWLGVPLKDKNKTFGVLVLQSYNNKNAYSEYDIKLLEFVSEQISVSILKKTTEEKLKKALLRAEESDKLKSAFLANMSHEIRTPMNGIIGFSGLLKSKDITRAQMDKYISIIEQSGDRMLNIINNLIDISKIEAGQMELIISDCDVNEQLGFLYTFFTVEANFKGLNLLLDTQNKKEKLIIKTDCEKLYAILANLIKNAIKYTNKGTIEFGYYFSNNDIAFFVKDTGIGIPDERQKAVFERFIQADIEDKRALEGAGLGLAISKAYVDMLGGTISVSSKEKVGTIFTVTLPINNTDINAEVNNESTGVTKQILSTDKQKLNIIIVEDEEFLIEFFKLILSNISNRIFIVNNDNAAVKVLKNHPDTDLIITNIKNNNLDVLKQFKTINDKIKIIGQINEVPDSIKEEEILEWYNFYLVRPIDKDILINNINILFGDTT